MQIGSFQLHFQANNRCCIYQVMIFQPILSYFFICNDKEIVMEFERDKFISLAESSLLRKEGRRLSKEK